MAKNRIIPYGYKIENGKLKVNINESNVVIKIFEDYANGESYKKIADKLTMLNIEYNDNKSKWSKNLVARILQNSIYIGNDKYPRIIKDELLEKVTMNSKHLNKTESKDIKNIKSMLKCEKCGAILNRRHKPSGEERWYCPNAPDHINSKLSDSMLIDSIYDLQKKIDTTQIIAEKNAEIENEHTIFLNKQIILEMKSSELSIEELREQIISLAINRYKNIENLSKYEKNIKNEISKIKDDLDTVSLLKIVKEIRVSDIKATQILLINGQIIK